VRVSATPLKLGNPSLELCDVVMFPAFSFPQVRRVKRFDELSSCQSIPVAVMPVWAGEWIDTVAVAVSAKMVATSAIRILRSVIAVLLWCGCTRTLDPEDRRDGFGRAIKHL
jgi:hypothetical protein